ncbi:MAG: hypothetical protein GY953_35055, partial [bacterium]|nr:hypothetical protein [bacterium]
LAELFRTGVDQWEVRHAPKVEFSSSKDGDVVRLEFAGRMATAGRVAGPVSFQTTWTLSGHLVRADHRIEFAEERQVSRVSVGSTVLRSDIDEYGVVAGPPDDPNRRKMGGIRLAKAEAAGQTLFSEHHTPNYVLFFDRGVEGLDFQTGSDLATWESGLTGRGGAGRYEARVSADGATIEVRREPLHVPRPLKVTKGSYTFSYYLGLPRIVEKSNRKWRHLAFNNQPWPPDEEIARWAENGVNVARLHNDFAEGGKFWHDGAWPPYDEQGMAELRRVIATCHRHGIQVVPYFSMHEFHPEAGGYQENEQAWKRTMDQAGTVYHNKHGSGEFGAQMCPLSGWLDRKKSDVERAYRELGFDGIYYDWVIAIPCNHPRHRPGLHLGTDGVIDLLGWTRRLIGADGVMILHSSGWWPSITFENFGDLIVNLEDLSRAENLLRPDQVLITGVLGESIPRSPCPSYRTDRARERTQANIASLVVLGLFPHSGSSRSEAYEQTLELFRRFKPYRLEDYRLHDGLSGAVQTGWNDVFGAVYGSPEQALVVLSNVSSRERKNVVWRVSPEMLGIGSPAKVQVKDTVSGQTQIVSLEELTNGALVTGLEGYEYRLFEIQPGGRK